MSEQDWLIETSSVCVVFANYCKKNEVGFAENSNRFSIFDWIFRPYFIHMQNIFHENFRNKANIYRFYIALKSTGSIKWKEKKFKMIIEYVTSDISHQMHISLVNGRESALNVKVMNQTKQIRGF